MLLLLDHLQCKIYCTAAALEKIIKFQRYRALVGEKAPKIKQHFPFFFFRNPTRLYAAIMFSKCDEVVPSKSFFYQRKHIFTVVLSVADYA